MAEWWGMEEVGVRGEVADRGRPGRVKKGEEVGVGVASRGCEHHGCGWHDDVLQLLLLQ